MGTNPWAGPGDPVPLGSRSMRDTDLSPDPGAGPVEVYARRRFRLQAADLVQRLRDEGRFVRPGDTRFFNPRQTDPATALVYHDGTDPQIPWHYEARGVECRLIPGCSDKGHAAVAREPYIVKHDDGFQLQSPEGQPVGTPQPNEARAWAQREES